ncbi:MAG: hypothetical protein BroJett029_00150 [Alphaproteobacteria bacterium]|nr:MAG: hypothetical protein BroJett029_00150 [Alphaproteobacteria bacterium]
MSGGSGTTTTVQQADPWSKQQPYLEEVFREAQRLYQQPGPYYYPGQTTASFSPESELAMTAQAARAMSGSPLAAASGQEILGTLGGQYLNAGNPYFSGMVGRIANELRPRLDSQFAASGRYASGAHQEAATRALADAASSLAYQNYADERARMQQAAQLAPQLAQLDYADIAQLGAVGKAREQMQQALINEQIARFNFAQQLPANKLAQYSGLIQGNYGGTTTTTAPSESDGLLAGAKAGFGLAEGIFNSTLPWPAGLLTAGLGAILGGL